MMTVRHIARPWLSLAVGAVGLAGLVATAVVSPAAAVAGWLIGFVWVLAIPLGCLVLMMIHALTGGRWGEGMRPVLTPAAAVLPVVAIFFLPLLLGLDTIFPWARGAAGVAPGVADFYLAAPWFVARAALALAGWCILALALPRLRGQTGQLIAALGLVFYALTITIVATDWILSIEPPFISTSFGASLAIAEIAAALAFAALFAPSLAGEGVVRDLAGLLLSAILGLTYIDFMAILILWYGDIPEKVTWLVERTAAPWNILTLAALAIGFLLPVAMLMTAPVRGSPRGVRIAGGLVLCGLTIYVVVLVAPPFGVWAGLAGVAAIVAQTGLVFAAAMLWANRAGRSLARWSDA